VRLELKRGLKQIIGMKTIATCQQLIEAQILQATLGGSGIQAYLPEELTAQTSGNAYNYAMGGLRVQVEEEDVDAARTILADFNNAAAGPENP
jgi:hypothetical protein